MSDKLQEAIAAITAGDKATGKQSLIEVLRADQRNEIAWLWMTKVVGSNDERIKCLENVLKINPNNETAKRGVALLRQKQTKGQKIEPQFKPLKSLSTPPPSPEVKTTKQCPYCAERIKIEAKVCRFCGRDFETGQPSQPSVTHQTQAPVVTQSLPQRLWNPGIAAVLSLVIPGAGQMYKGQVGKGLFYLFVIVIGYALFIVPGLILHILCIVDATRGNPYQETETGQQTTQIWPEKKAEDSSKSSKLPPIILLGIPAGLVGFCVLVLLVILSAGTPPIENESSKQVPTPSLKLTRDQILEARRDFDVQVISFDASQEFGDSFPYSDYVRLKITNNSSVVLPYLTVLTKRYDSSGKMIGSSRAPSIPTNQILPNETVEYDYYPKGHLPGVDKIIVEIEQVIDLDSMQFFKELE